MGFSILMLLIGFISQYSDYQNIRKDIIQCYKVGTMERQGECFQEFTKKHLPIAAKQRELAVSN